MVPMEEGLLLHGLEGPQLYHPPIDVHPGAPGKKDERSKGGCVLELIVERRNRPLLSAP